MAPTTTTTAETASTIESISPFTGESTGAVAEATATTQVDAIARAAAAAAPAFDALGRGRRAALLRRLADFLEESRDEIISTAHAETAIPEARLGGELNRTAYQARFFADVITDGAYLEATIDHAGDTPMGPGPDLRSMLVPTGPVAVFGASNFPLAFSVPGGDTVSALAAGNPVVIKAHSSHPRLSQLTFGILNRAAAETGAPKGTVGIVYGTAAGGALVAHPAITAVGFTGSLTGGQALLDIIAERENPIPFFGELSSINPLVVSPGAAASRGTEIAAGLVGSFTTSGGQLCTKPGVVYVPVGADGDNLVAEAARQVEGTDSSVLLNQRIAGEYADYAAASASWTDVSVVAEGTADPDGTGVAARLLETSAKSINGRELSECFGPTTIIIRYGDSELDAVLETLPGSLTATVHSEPGEEGFAAHVFDQLRPKAGRLLHNGYPTGVLVSWAQTHGGPWPSTNTQYTSVGAHAIRRWLRPLTWQDVPEALLPAELREGRAAIPRRIDGDLITPAVG